MLRNTSTQTLGQATSNDGTVTATENHGRFHLLSTTQAPTRLLSGLIGSVTSRFTCLLKPCFSSSTKVWYTLQGRSVALPYARNTSRNTTDCSTCRETRHHGDPKPGLVRHTSRSKEECAYLILWSKAHQRYGLARELPYQREHAHHQQQLICVVPWRKGYD